MRMYLFLLGWYEQTSVSEEWPKGAEGESQSLSHDAKPCCGLLRAGLDKGEANIGPAPLQKCVGDFVCKF